MGSSRPELAVENVLALLEANDGGPFFMRNLARFHQFDFVNKQTLKLNDTPFTYGDIIIKCLYV